MSLEVPGSSDGTPTPDGTTPSATNLRQALSSVEAGVLFMKLAGKKVKGSENVADEPKDATPKQKGKEKKHSLKGPSLTQDSKDGKGKKHSLKGQIPDMKAGKGQTSDSKDGKGKRNSIKGSTPDVKDGKDKRQSIKGPMTPDIMKLGEEVPTINADDSTDLYEDMDETTLSTFRDLFNMLDQSNTGIITADNLFEELRRVDSEITFDEVDDVLKKVDKDGNGEIDFDEFLYHMTHMGTEPDESADDETKKKYRKRKRMFYNAITQFSIRQTLADIEKTIKKHEPHVIGHYSDGVRLIGLTTRQLMRQMRKMQKTFAKNDSPYAHPLPFVNMGAKTLVHKKKIIPATVDTPTSCRDLPQEEQAGETTPTPTVVADLNSIQNTMKLFTETAQTEVGKMPDANLIMKLRKKIGSVKAQLRSKTQEEQEGDSTASPQGLTPSINIERSATTTPVLDNATSGTCSTIPMPFSIPIARIKSAQGKVVPVPSSFNVKEAATIKKKQRIGKGWVAPRIQYVNVPLPRVYLKRKKRKPTFNDLYKIRAKVEKASNVYYHNLRQAEIKNASDRWDRLYADVVLPKKQLDNLRTVYNAYFSQREEEAFVVSPWKPGPLCCTGQHTSKSQSVGGSPNRFIGGRSPRIKSTLDHLIIKPLINVNFRSETSSRCSTPNLCSCLGKKPFGK